MTDGLMTVEPRVMIVCCIPERLGNSTLTVRVDGMAVGKVLQDAPGTWIIVRDPVDEPTFPTLDAVVRELLVNAGVLPACDGSNE